MYILLICESHPIICHFMIYIHFVELELKDVNIRQPKTTFKTMMYWDVTPHFFNCFFFKFTV
jgi:hypothetical protein